MDTDDLAVDTIGLDLTLLEETVVVRLDELGEAELTGDEDLLTAGELHLSTTESLAGLRSSFVGGSDGEEDLTNADTSGLAESLTEGTTHTLLESISTGARKHLVDTQHVERVQAHAKVETFLTSLGHHVLVRGNTAGFHRLGADLFLFETTNREKQKPRITVSLLARHSRVASRVTNASS